MGAHLAQPPSGDDVPPKGRPVELIPAGFAETLRTSKGIVPTGGQGKELEGVAPLTTKEDTGPQMGTTHL